jgi:tetratricopeptide (TPR) repeat protein
MLTGRHPFMEEDESGSTPSVLTRQISSPLYLPRTEGLSSSTRLTLQRCLEKDPRLRPQDATCLRRQLGSEGRLTWLFHHLRLRRPLRFTLLGTAVVTLTGLIYLWITLPASRVVQEDETLIAKNALGRELWRREPGEEEKLAGWIEGRDENGQRAISALYKPRESSFTYTLDQIKPGAFPITRRGWNLSRGQPLYDHDLNLGLMHYYDFFPFSHLIETYNRDLNGDGQAEMVVMTMQAGSMFPSLMSVWGAPRNHLKSIFSPGRIHVPFARKTLVENRLTHPEQVGMLATSNPFCHYNLWFWNLHADTIQIPPAFSTEAAFHLKTSDLVFLPQECHPITNDRLKSGRMTFNSPKYSLTIDIVRNGTMSISGTREKRFIENFSANAAAVSALNQAYIEINNQRVGLADQAMKNLDTTDIFNPWLLSLIAYFRGETALMNGRYTQAQTWYQQALADDPNNGDARNRLSELMVLSQGPAVGLQYFDEHSQFSGQFWGLGDRGQQLFRMSCLLMSGATEQANDIVQRLAKDPISYDDSGWCLGLLYQAQEPRLDQAIEGLLKPKNSLESFFDISELQIILCRLWMVNKDWRKAEPLLRYFTTQTILHKPFAEVSLAWCEAEAGKTAAAVERAERAFAMIRRMAKSQFWARFWLFYDAYAYGRTMEKAGQPQKAREGYRLCANLAPSSFLGNEARRHLVAL